MFLNELSEPQLLVIYPGRFQPFHKGHHAVFEWLSGKFGRHNVVIATSNKVDPPRSPFSFAEKAYFMQLTGVPMDRIVQATSPYNISNVLSGGQVAVQDPNNTVVIFAISEKDMEEDPRFGPNSFTKKDGSPAYLQKLGNIKQTENMTQHAYIMTVPTFDFNVLGQPMRSGTELREMYTNADTKTRQAIIKDLFGTYTPEAEKIMNTHLPNPADAEPVAAPKLAKTTKLKAVPKSKVTVKEATLPTDAPPGSAPQTATAPQAQTTNTPQAKQASQALQKGLARYQQLYPNTDHGFITRFIDHIESDGTIVVAGDNSTGKIKALLAQGGGAQFRVVNQDELQIAQQRPQVRTMPESGMAKEATGDSKFDRMMKTIKTGTKKQATADRREQKRQDQERTRAAIDNMFGSSMNQFKNLKIKEQGAAEGSQSRLQPGTQVMLWLGPKDMLPNPPRDDKRYWDRGVVVDEPEKMSGSWQVLVKSERKGQSPISPGRVFVLKQPDVTEAGDPNFVGFMNKSLGNKVDRPKENPLANAPDFYKNAPVANLDTNSSQGQALKWGIGILQKISPAQKAKLASLDEYGVESWLEDLAVKQGMAMDYNNPGDDDDRDRFQFAQEDIGECQELLGDVFHDPNINTWLDLIKSEQGVAEGLSDTQKKIEDTILKLEQRLKFAKTPEQWDNIKNRIERLQAGLTRSKTGVAEGTEQQFMIYFVVPEHEDYSDRNEPTERTIVVANSPGEAARLFKAETPEAYIKDVVAMKQGVAEGLLKESVIRSETIGPYTHELHKTPWGYQVRVYAGGKQVHSDITKPTEEKGQKSFDSNIAYTKKQLRINEQGMAEDMYDTVTFGVDSEKAYNQVMAKFGKAISWHGDDMVAPRKYWAAIQQLAHDAGGAAEETGHEQDVAESGGVGVVKGGRDPRYSTATMGDQNDVNNNTLGQEMRAFGLTGRKNPGATRTQQPVNKDVGKGIYEQRQHELEKMLQNYFK